MGYRLQRDQLLGLRDALARLNLNTMPVATALPEYDAVRRQLLGAHIQYNSLAQAIKLFSSLSRAIQPIDQILSGEFDREEPRVIIPRQTAGCAAMEAPRGTLIHYYRFDSRGVYTGADIITPTAINKASMERDLQIAARALDGAEDKELVRQLEVIIRAYDPCISCAVHFVAT
ncbi:MAG TPA: nickel-dependent hydrogenase large subunit [Geobacteraceae bacterium]